MRLFCMGLVVGLFACSGAMANNWCDGMARGQVKIIDCMHIAGISG